MSGREKATDAGTAAAATVQSPENAAGGTGLGILAEVRRPDGQAGVFRDGGVEDRRVEGPREEAAIVAVGSGQEDQDVRQGRGDDAHVSSLTRVDRTVAS